MTTAVTAAGRGGGLWLLLCVVTAWRSRDNRRQAVRSAAAVVAALAVSHLVKRAVPHRPRPEPPGGPARRRLPEQPDSSSFPSAHAATAAAFTTAAINHNRLLAAVTAPLALTATYGRLRTRVHWPTDVLAGIAIGIGTARTLERRVRQH